MRRFRNVKHLGPYIEAIERNENIKKWCKEKKFVSFEEAYLAMKEEKPEWYDALRKSVQSKMILESYFENREKEKKLVEARAIARKGEPNTRRAKPVICIDNGMEFSSINQAAKWLNHKRTHDISDCCYGIIDNVKGYHFRFKEEI